MGIYLAINSKGLIDTAPYLGLPFSIQILNGILMPDKPRKLVMANKSGNIQLQEFIYKLSFFLYKAGVYGEQMREGCASSGIARVPIRHPRNSDKSITIDA